MVRRTASRRLICPSTMLCQVGQFASSKSAMKVEAPEFSALITILRSVGPVSSTRRSSRSFGCGATCHSRSLISRVSGRKSGSAPRSNSFCRAALLASKLLLAGHTVRLVGLPAEAELINKEGARVRMPVKGREGLIEVDSRKLPGKLSALLPVDVKPADYDLVALAMQEPQYRSPGVRELLDAVAKARVPCMSIMNMPPLPYLARIPGVSADACRSCYTDPTVWDRFDPALMTLCSPDPQAFRPPEEKLNVLQVRLPTNFKSARFPS